MPTYRNDGASIQQIEGLAGQALTLAPGASGQTYRLYDRAGLTEIDPAPYWSPALAVSQPAGGGDLAPIAIDADCHCIEVWNNSPSTLSVRLRAAAAVAVVLPSYTTRRIYGPGGLPIRAVCDALLISADVEVAAGQVVVTQLREGGK
jgi:hypothetical protein